MKIARIFLAGLAAAVFTVAFDGNGFAEKFDALPKAVKATANAQMENAFPLSISSSKGEQGWDYQINTLVNGKHHNIVIEATGKLIALKDETELTALPSQARAAIEKQASAAKIMTLEKVTEGGQVSYGAVMRDEAQGTLVQVRVTADGNLKSKN